MEEANRMKLGLPPSRLRIPTESDPESVHREFFSQRILAEKIEKEIELDYMERIEKSSVVQPVDLDPELLTGWPLIEKEANWVKKKKQARRAGPRSSNWTTTMRTDDQFIEYIRYPC
ncbi:unnamed protein product [Mucor fragilis]